MPPRRLTALIAGALTSLTFAAEAPLEVPTPIDERLQIRLYASDPDIVTPIGAAVDSRGRLFVLESHTHSPPQNYAGPKSDRVKIFAGRASDGRAEKISLFAENIQQGLSLAFSPDGTLYSCNAKEVVALPDRDGDGRADTVTAVVRLVTENTNPHGQLLGLTFSSDGWLYIARGNVGGSAYAWVGSDGSRIAGYGEGGDVVRCRPDGTKLEVVATGFWNPFDLRFDTFGRLLLVDNDPDSRGPNRLLHIVPGGDYGFKSLYGATGLHPYVAWEGDLPGTLPLVGGVGEAPSAVLDLSFTALPPSYRDALLVTVWGEHTLTLFRTRPSGVSLRGTAEPFLKGGRNFRPVALAPAPDGTLYLTDWVLSNYPNHGRGRIWTISAKPGVDRMKPRAVLSPPEPNPAFARFEELRTASRPEQFDALRQALLDDDAFVRSAALDALARPVFQAAITLELESSNSRIRLGAVLALRRAAAAAPAPILRRRLADPDPQVRQMALIWTGEKVLRNLRAEVDAAIALPGVTPRLFETWLATIDLLDSDVTAQHAQHVAGFRIKRPTPQALIEQIVADERRPAAVRALALPRLASLDAPKNHALLLRLVQSTEPALQVEALRQLSTSGQSDTAPVLRALALDRNRRAEVRAEALVALSGHADAALAPLLDDPDGSVRVQAARTLRFSSSDPVVRAAATRKLASLGGDSASAALKSQLEFLLGAPVSTPRPETVESWQKLLAQGGDADAGRRVFFSPAAMCLQCHQIGVRGGTIGPNLSVVGRTANRYQIIHSIIKPSDEVAPQFQGWEIRKTSGDVITGLQGHLRSGRGASIIPIGGREVLVSNQELAYFGALPHSLMPEGLEALLSVEEFRDLVAFLAAQK